MKRLLTTIAVLLCFPALSISQAKHSGWCGQFIVRSNSYLLPFIPSAITQKIAENYMDDSKDLGFSTYAQWFQTAPEWDIHVPKWLLEGPDGKIATQGPVWWRCLLFGDYKHNYNFSLGYSLCWRSYDIPIGAKIRINYEWRGLCVNESELMGLHRISGIVPSVSLNWHVLGNDFERENNWNLIVEPGVAYVKNLTYNDPLKMGKEAVNDGWRGFVTMGFYSRKTHGILSLRYEWDAYDFFKLQGVTSRMNSLVFSVAIEP